MAFTSDFLQVGETRGISHLFWLTLGAGVAAAVVSAMVISLALRCDPMSRMARLEESRWRVGESYRIVHVGYGTPGAVALIALTGLGVYLRRRLRRQHQIHPVDEYPYLGAFTAASVLLLGASILLNPLWIAQEVSHWNRAPEYAALPLVNWFISGERFLMFLILMGALLTWHAYKEG